MQFPLFYQFWKTIRNIPEKSAKLNFFHAYHKLLDSESIFIALFLKLKLLNVMRLRDKLTV